MKSFIWKTTVLFLSLPLYIYLLFKAAFSSISGELPLQYILIIVVAGFLIGFFVHEISSAFIVFASSLICSIAITTFLVKLPVDTFISSISGSVTAIIALKGILTYVLFLVAPLSLPSVIGGCYVRDRTLGEPNDE